MSFPKLVKIICHCLLHSKQDHGFTYVYPSLQIENISPYSIFNSDQDPLFELHNINDQLCESHNTKVDTTLLSHDSVPSKIQNQYRPLQLPHVLHDFPTKHYKYLPRFGGESDNLTTEKHLQSFENFINILEIEHDDVCMRDFSRYLQGDVKEWFKHLQHESIKTWEEFNYVFLKLWGKRRPIDQILS